MQINFKLDEFYRSKAGEYIFNGNILNIYQGGNTDRVIYHELMHFIDYNLNSNYPDATYIYDGKFLSKSEYNKLSATEKENVDIVLGYVNLSYTTFMVEGGAELYSSKYFINSVTQTYGSEVNLYYLFEYVFSCEKMDGVFFGEESLYTLTNGYFSEDGFTNFLHALYTITYDSDASNADYSYVLESLVDLYGYTHKGKWYDDKEFCLLLYNYIGENTEWFSESAYKDTFSSVYDECNKLYHSYSDNFADYVGTDSYVYPRIMYENNKTYLFTFINIETENEYFVKFLFDGKKGSIKEVERRKNNVS